MFGATSGVHVPAHAADRCSRCRAALTLHRPGPDSRRTAGEQAVAGKPDPVRGARRVRRVAAGADPARPVGYPILASAQVPADLEPLARRAVKSCPTLALLLERVTPKRIST